MRRRREVAAQELVWKQPAGSKQEYELLAGDEVLASMRWRRSWGSLAEATAEDGTWTIKRVGFWHPRATIRAAGRDEDLATFEARWTGNGVLTFAGGVTYRWEGANI